MSNQKEKPRDLGARRGADIGQFELANPYVKPSKNTSKKPVKLICSHGHPWTDETTYNHDNGRNCRVCNAGSARDYRRRLKRLAGSK